MVTITLTLPLLKPWFWICVIGFSVMWFTVLYEIRVQIKKFRARKRGPLTVGSVNIPLR
jgi:hypothetical protein